MKCIKKRFSIGLSLNMSNEEFIKILDCYSPYIKDVYFSPPLGENYHTRKAIHENYMQDNAEERLYELLAYSLKKGLKIELALNGHGMKEENVVQALNYICDKIEVDSIVTLNNINENYINESIDYYYLWARLGHFSSHYRNLKYDTIIEYKKYLWQKEKLNWKEEKII